VAKAASDLAPTVASYNRWAPRTNGQRYVLREGGSGCINRRGWVYVCACVGGWVHVSVMCMQVCGRSGVWVARPAVGGVVFPLDRCVDSLPHRFLQLEKELVEVDQMVKDADGDPGQLFS